jgi:hypothetical protein
MEVQFYESKNDGLKTTGVSDNAKVVDALSQAFKSGSTFAKKHDLDEDTLKNFKMHLNKEKIIIRGNDVNGVLEDLGNHAQDFKLSISKLHEAAIRETLEAAKKKIKTTFAAGIAGITAVTLAPPALEKAGDTYRDYEEGKHIRKLVKESSSMPNVIFPDELLTVTKEDRKHPEFVKIVEAKLGSENLLRDPDKGSRYFTMITKQPGRKASFEKVHMNAHELESALRTIDEEVKRRNEEKATGQFAKR